MAHHQRTSHDRTLASQGLSSGSALNGSANMPTAGDDDLASEVDEPPDSRFQFAKRITPSSQSSNTHYGYMSPATPYGNESLLTQALLSSPEMNPMSDAEAPVLTSDGGLTSPARTTTPSPPLPTLNSTGFATLVSKLSKGFLTPKNKSIADTVQIAQKTSIDSRGESKVEEGLGRRRCISFACGQQAAAQKKVESPAQGQDNTEVLQKPANPPKRPCMLKFACPMKPTRTETANVQPRQKSPNLLENNSTLTKPQVVESIPVSATREHRDSNATIKNSPAKDVSLEPVVAPQPRKAQVFNRVDFQKSEATRFHEFAGSFNAEDEWINEQTAYRQKITVNDTLRKENAIRKLADEAEEEALDEEEDEAEIDDDEGAELDDDDEEEEEEEGSDDGNETDDEEGFAESDDESDGDSEYQFWTPGLTTAATSTDQLEHIRPLTHRVDSDSSVESIINTKQKDPTRGRKASHAHKSPRMRPGTPDLPDSSDFVVGTIDEDRPLEDAYMSCLEERRRSKHRLIPQDIDPSFPTSEPEPENDEDEDDDATQTDHEPEWVMGRPDSSEEEHSAVRRKSSSSTKATKSPMPSPKRMHSPLPPPPPPPPRRSVVHRSPPPRRLFGQATHRLRSPPPMHRKLTSPPSSRRPSLTGSPHNKSQGLSMLHLAQRPNLTHTASLPRTPNPFWDQHRRSRFHSLDTPSAGTSPKTVGPSRMEVHSRGPIDIVQGLETKRQRRKDKFWRQHCRHAGKEKERRCQPGKGAQRMRELGLEMADRCRGYGQKAQLVLSV